MSDSNNDDEANYEVTIISSNADNRGRLGSLRIGTVFKKRGCTFIKTSGKEYEHSGEYRIVCVDLEGGERYEFEPNTTVIVPDRVEIRV